jgi:uncharacterized protein YkwD
MVEFLIVLGGWGVSLFQAPAAVPAAPPDLHPIEARIIERTNSERARHGLPMLAVDVRLVSSARRHTQWMTNARSMTHSSGVAENIAMGQSNSQEVLNAWMNSSGHRANILGRGYSCIGVAAYQTPEGTIYWCQQFR